MAKRRSGKKYLDSYTIKGTDKIVRVGDCVLMRPSDTSKPTMARVEMIEQDNKNNVRVRVRWYYRPEESTGGRREFHGSKEVFFSDNYDVQSADTIEGKCIVHTFKNYTMLENVGAEDYYCRFEYKAATGDFTPDRVAVYCKCNMPYNPDKLMVQCKGCKDWYHPACVGMTIEEARKLDDFQFVCSECSSDDDVKKPRATFPVSPGSDGKDFHISSMAKTSAFPTTANTSPPEGSLSQDVIATVEKSMKTHVDNLMQFLEGISSRLSQLELYCSNIDKSIGEMRSELNSDHKEADSKLKSLEKHLQEIHRSVQILSDKQEQAETQKELANVELVGIESSSSSHSQSNEKKSPPSATDEKRTDNAFVTTSDTHNQQLALALPHKVAFQQHPAAPPSQAPAPNVTQATQQPRYDMIPTPLPNPLAVAQLPRYQYLPSDPKYQKPQSSSSHVTQSPPEQQFSQYQQPQQQEQQWPQQLPQQVQPLHPPSMHSQMSQLRSLSVNVYTRCLTSQATSPPPTDALPNSMPLRMPHSGIPPPGSSHGDPMPYGYSRTGRTVPQQSLSQQINGLFPAQPGDVYGTNGTHTKCPPASAYMIYEGEGGRAHYTPQPSHLSQGGYPPPSASLQNPAPHNQMVWNPRQPQFIGSHPSLQ